MVDPGIPTRGGGGGCGQKPPRWGRQPIIWPNFHRKLHENERIWTQRERHASLAPPLIRQCIVLRSHKTRKIQNYFLLELISISTNVVIESSEQTKTVPNLILLERTLLNHCGPFCGINIFIFTWIKLTWKEQYPVLSREGVPTFLSKGYPHVLQDFI